MNIILSCTLELEKLDCMIHEHYTTSNYGTKMSFNLSKKNTSGNCNCEE